MSEYSTHPEVATGRRSRKDERAAATTTGTTTRKRKKLKLVRVKVFNGNVGHVKCDLLCYLVDQKIVDRSDAS